MIWIAILILIAVAALIKLGGLSVISVNFSKKIMCAQQRVESLATVAR